MICPSMLKTCQRRCQAPGGQDFCLGVQAVGGRLGRGCKRLLRAIGRKQGHFRAGTIDSAVETQTDRHVVAREHGVHGGRRLEHDGMRPHRLWNKEQEGRHQKRQDDLKYPAEAADGKMTCGGGTGAC